MKTYIVYDVNPRLLLKCIKEAKQPLVGIKFHGPATTKVEMACIGCKDNADDGVIMGIIAKIGGKKPASTIGVISGIIAKVIGKKPVSTIDDQEKELRKEFEL